MAVMKSKDGKHLLVDCECGCDEGLRIRINDFDEETYALFKKGGLSEDEIATLEYAELKARALEILPDDKKGMDRVFGALAAISKDTAEENAKNLALIAQKDPEMLFKLIALTEIYKSPLDDEETKS